MERHARIDSYAPPRSGVVLSIGNFDGVHLGHRALLRRARAMAQPLGAPVVVLTFEPHPLAILRPDRAPPRLTTARERAALLERERVDVLIQLATDARLLQTSAADFFEQTLVPLRPRAIVEGPTFNFGRGRAGSVQTLREMGAACGIDVQILDELRCRELPGAPPVNSSAIRAALLEGRLADANAMLGRPHRITGRVGAGAGRGAGLGFPTANLDGVAQLAPRDAVFAAVAQLPDQSLRLAAVNIGPQPTFEPSQPRVEAHVLDFDNDLRGRMLGLHLLARLRGQVKFAGVEPLAAQLRADVEAVRRHEPARRALMEAGVIPLLDGANG